MKDTLTLSVDTLQPVEQVVPDTSAITITGTTVVSVADMPKENQPNGWVQLLLPIGITLFVVFLEKWVSNFFEQRREKKARKLYRETVLDWIKQIMPIEYAFAKLVHLLAKTLNETDEMQPVAFALPLTLHNKLSDMTVEKMTESFLKDFKKDKNNRYVKMYSIISGFEFLSRITEKVTDSYNTYNRQFNDYNKEWNKAYIAFVDYYNRLPKGNPYEETMFSWINEMMSEPQSLMVKFQFTNRLSGAAFNQKDFDAMSMAERMNRVVSQIMAMNKGYAKVFEDIANNIDSSIKSLSESEEYFRELENN